VDRLARACAVLRVRHETYRFVSEFGFESLPAVATVAAFAPDPADWNLGSPLLDHHQRCPVGNARILYYMAQQFRLPKDFPSLVYLSQVLHAEAMRVGLSTGDASAPAAVERCTGSSTIAGPCPPGRASTTSAGGRRSTTPRGGSTLRCCCPQRWMRTESRWPSPTTGPRPGGARSAGRLSGWTRSRGVRCGARRGAALVTTSAGRVPLPTPWWKGDPSSLCRNFWSPARSMRWR